MARRVTSPGVPPAAIALVAGVALAVRAAHLWSLSSSPLWSATMGDAVAYLEWARRIAGGDWIGTETFYQAPLYPYVLAAILKLTGASLAGIRIVQIGIGAASCALLAWAAGRLFTPATGVVAGLLLAVYPAAVFFDGLIQKTVLDSVLVSGLIACVALIAAHATWPRTIALGVVLGLLALTRENALIGIPVVLWWLWVRGPGWPRAAAGVVVGASLVLIPVGVRNAAVGGRFQLTTSQLGPNLYIGNSPTATGRYVPLRAGHGSAEFERRDAIELAERATGRALGPGEVSDYWTRQAIAWATRHPGDWARLLVEKVLLAWNAAEAADTEDIATHAEASPVLRLRRVLHFGVLAPLGLLGMWIHRARWRELGVLYALVPAYTIAVAAFYVFDRYRFPLVPFLAVFAAAALTHGAAWWRSGSAWTRAWGIAIVAAAGIACNWPLLDGREMQASTAFNLGYALTRDGRYDDAVTAYRRAIALTPAHARARSNLGSLLTQRGEHDEALSQLREAVRLDPDLPGALTNLAIELSSRNQPEEALALLQRALMLDPQNVETRHNLAVAHNNIGATLAIHGDVRRALDHFARAVETEPSNGEFARNLAQAKAIVAQESTASGSPR